MNETAYPTARAPISFESEGQMVIGVVHRPLTDGATRRPALVMLHGLVGSKDSPHQLFVRLAERLAQGGVISLRIDFRGRGDSAGETVDITPEADLTDACNALDYLLDQPDVDPERIGLLGLSWGGSIAALLAGRDRRIGSVALWSNGLGPADWQPEFTEVDDRRVVELWGNLVGEQFYAGLRRLDPLSELARARGPVLLAYGTGDESIAPQDVERARQTLAAHDIAHEVVAIAGADHVFMHYRWERALIDRTVAWFRRTL